MPVDFCREEISNGIYFSKISDKKFKCNNINIRLITDLSDKTTSFSSLLTNVAVTTNANYPNRTDMTKRLSQLYGAYISTGTYKCADNLVLSFNANSICDEYALDDEKIAMSVEEILLDCIFNPLLEDGGFAKKDFDLRKQELLDGIDSEINEKRTYALTRAASTIYRDEAYSVPYYGQKEIIKNINPKELYKYSQEVIRTAKIEITYSGGSISDEVCKVIKNKFAEIERDFSDRKFISYSHPKAEAEYVYDYFEVSQSKMVMAFKSDYDNLFACKLMSLMFGGTAFSKLFVNVREKLSLCYYCVSGYVEGKGTMIVDSGVEFDNIEIAQNEIVAQLKLLADGSFTEDEFENAKLGMISSFRSNYDSLNQLSSWYFYQSIRGTSFSPDDTIAIINAITRAEVIKAAKSMKLDTVYVMRNKENEVTYSG